jgi:hypothetical protein
MREIRATRPSYSMCLVGNDGIEPSTSRLSGEHSHH